LTLASSAQVTTSTNKPQPDPKQVPQATTDAAVAAKKLQAAEPNNKSNEAVGKKPVPSFHPNLLGANLDVLKSLEKVQFVDYSDGAMSNSTAYLQLWVKGGTSPVSSTTPSADASGTPAYTNTRPANIPTPAAATTSTQTTATATGSKNPPNVPSVKPTEPDKRPSAEILGSTQGSYVVPVDSKAVNGATAVGVANDSYVKAPLQQPSKVQKALKKVVGRVFSGNPGGRITPGVREQSTSPVNIVDYKSKNLYDTGKNTGSDPQASGNEEGVWQFLFNPEEINIQGNSTYAAAETWGVQDTPKPDGSGNDLNSGQPLQWRFNQNEKMVLNRVLLNGFVFGRRVDSLDRGLKELVSLAQPGGAGGPPVLNFVWGERTFGPCVIREFNIKEKNWDAGYLVNAEISLTLERVPEWVINDGMVDVARPGRQGPINDPTEMAGGETDPYKRQDSPPAPNTNLPQSGSGDSILKSADYLKCVVAPTDMLAQAGGIKKTIESLKGVTWKTLFPPQVELFTPRARVALQVYSTFYGFAVGQTGSFFTQQFDGKNRLYKPEGLKRAVDLILNSSDLPIAKKIKIQDLLLKAINTVIDALKNIPNQKQCKKITAEAKSAREAKDKAYKNKALGGKTSGKSCKDSVLNLKDNEQWVNPVNKNLYMCLKGVLAVVSINK